MRSKGDMTTGVSRWFKRAKQPNSGVSPAIQPGPGPCRGSH